MKLNRFNNLKKDLSKPRHHTLGALNLSVLLLTPSVFQVDLARRFTKGHLRRVSLLRLFGEVVDAMPAAVPAACSSADECFARRANP
jgi:hypothetical protein